MEVANQRLLTYKQVTTIFEDVCAEIYHVHEGNVVYVRVKGATKNQCYQVNAERALASLQRLKTAKLLMDFSGLVMMSTNDQKWTEDVWQKEAIKVGLKRMASVMPDNLFAALSINKLLENIKSKDSFENASFTSEVEAYDWLLSSPLAK
jgi:hypothetical protein